MKITCLNINITGLQNIRESHTLYINLSQTFSNKYQISLKQNKNKHTPWCVATINKEIG